MNLSKTIYERISILLILLFSVACKKEISQPPLGGGCNLYSKTAYVENQTGILVPTSMNASFNHEERAYLIVESNAEGGFLPLEVCNLPQTLTHFVAGDSITVKFSGNVAILPETVDALSTLIELTQIDVITKD